MKNNKICAHWDATPKKKQIELLLKYVIKKPTVTLHNIHT